jgi:hypothetical protein
MHLAKTAISRPRTRISLNATEYTVKSRDATSFAFFLRAAEGCHDFAEIMVELEAAF